MSDEAGRFALLESCRRHYGTNISFLEYKNAFELMISVILSAQTTDEQVNRVTPRLFARYPDPKALAEAPLESLEEIIRSTGYYRAKARHIQGAARHLLENCNGEVPSLMEELVKIPGVGRKSAGVVLHHVFGKPAIIVDTHFGRVARRLGLSAHEDPEKLEFDLAKKFPPADWGDLSMLLNLHGRRFCHARKPNCVECFLIELCPSAIVCPNSRLKRENP